MRKSPLLSSLIVALFLLVPPVYAVNYTGEAWLDWTTLEISGIPITMTAPRQGHIVTIAPVTGPIIRQDHQFQDWRDHNATLSIPQVATAFSSADAERLYTSFGKSGSPAGQAEVFRDSRFTAMDTGNLTISIDYALQHNGVEVLQDSIGSANVFLQLGRDQSPLLADRGELVSTSGDRIETGTLSLTRLYQSGDSGGFFTAAHITASGGGSSVPVPDMLWPTMVGMIGLAFWAERRRRQGHFAQ